LVVNFLKSSFTWISESWETQSTRLPTSKGVRRYSTVLDWKVMSS